MRFLGILMNDFESEELDPMVPGFLFTGFESNPFEGEKSISFM